MVDFGQIPQRRGEFYPLRRNFSLEINQIRAVKMPRAGVRAECQQTLGHIAQDGDARIVIGDADTAFKVFFK